MKLFIGKPDGTELALAQQEGEAWRPTPSLVADMTAFLANADPEQFELWVEEDDEE